MLSPLLLTGSYCSLSQSGGVVPNAELYHLDSSTDRSTKSVWYLGHVFQPHSIIFKELQNIAPSHNFLEGLINYSLIFT